MKTNEYSFFNEMQTHLLKDKKPSEYLGEVINSDIFKQHPLIMLRRLIETPQPPKYHAEGNVWNHTMLVVDEAAKVRRKSYNTRVFMWSALLHDIGKATTTKVIKEKITAYGHDKEGARLAYDFLVHFSGDMPFIKNVCALVKYHMQILYVLKGLPYADIEGMKKETDVFEVALLGLCDRLGRAGSDYASEERNMEVFLRLAGGK